MSLIDFVDLGSGKVKFVEYRDAESYLLLNVETERVLINKNFPEKFVADVSMWPHFWASGDVTLKKFGRQDGNKLIIEIPETEKGEEEDGYICWENVRREFSDSGSTILEARNENRGNDSGAIPNSEWDLLQRAFEQIPEDRREGGKRSRNRSAKRPNNGNSSSRSPRRKATPRR